MKAVSECHQQARQNAVLSTLLACGASLCPLSGQAAGLADYLVAFKGKTFLLVLEGNRSANHLHIENRLAWLGLIISLESIEDALAFINFYVGEKSE